MQHMSIFRNIVCVFLYGLSAFGQSATGVTASVGTIAGTTVDASTGKPLTGVVVTAVRTGFPPFSANAAVDGLGVYALAGLPAGTYNICASYSGDGYLDPCQWNSIPPTVTLTAGQALTGHTVKLTPGSVLKIQVQDPNQVLSNAVSAGKPANVSAGVFGAFNMFHPAHLVGKDSSGNSNYQITIPRDTFLAIHITSAHFKLGDASSPTGGNDLAGNYFQQRFQHRTGDANPPSFAVAAKAVLP
jgi:hypothetical protein